MTRECRQLCQPRPLGTRLLGGAILLAALLQPAAAQDIRGLEACVAEKQMERRTGCLQANVEFLQQVLTFPRPSLTSSARPDSTHLS